MNIEMAYLLGMICGNGEIQRGITDTTVAIEIPHKVNKTDDFHDIGLYVKASLDNIRKNIEPLISTGIVTTQSNAVTRLSFTKPNADYLIREINQFIGLAITHDNIRIHDEIFVFSKDQRIIFLRGFSDVTGYVRRSNRYMQPYEHRVYIEIPHNWELVIDICNLLKSVDVPVQNIDWAHPNMRDGKIIKYNKGYKTFWKKEHQIKIWVNEFLPINFGILHKQQSLENFAKEFASNYTGKKSFEEHTHRYYWEYKKQDKIKPIHPGENDIFIPAKIRGKHYNSWKNIAEDLGYGK